MKVAEMQTKLDELKKKSQLTEEEKTELAELESQIEEGQAKSRYDELSTKDENLLTSEEVDELITLGEKFAEEPKLTPEEGSKKYAGIYETPEKLIEGLLASEKEATRITEEMKKDPKLAEIVENAYKDSQRRVTKLVADRKKAVVSPDISMIPLNSRELGQMTREEYDSWEKQDKLGAHAWLSNATRKESLIQDSRMKVLRKYKGWAAEIQGIAEPSSELIEWDKIEKEQSELKQHSDWPERVMTIMEKNLGISTKAEPRKPIIVKPGFEQGKVTVGKKSGGKRLSDEEFAALSSEEQRAHLESQAPK